MKKVFIILSLLTVLLVGALLTLPVVFKSMIRDIAIEKANSSLNATFSYRKFNLSLINSFPDLTATFLNVSITGKNSLEKDTLISISELSARIYLPSVLKKKGIKIEEIFIDNLDLNLLENKVKIHLKTALLAGHEQFDFKFKDGESKINDHPLSVTGGFSMPSDSMLFDIQFENHEMTMQQILSIVPDNYSKYFKEINATGNVSLTGKISGHYYKDLLPLVEISLKIKDGIMKYPGISDELKIKVASAAIFKPEGSRDSLMLGIDIQNMQLAGNPVNLNATVKSLMTDPTIDVKLNGTVDVEKLTKIFPIDSVILKGLIKADAAFSGKISDIKKNNFGEFVSTAYFNLKDVYLQNSSHSMNVLISQGIAELKNRDLKIAIKQLLFNEINITDLKGKIELKNHQLTLSDFGMNMLDGTLKMDGTITADGEQNQVVDFNLDATKFDLPTAYRDLSIVQKYLPFAEKTEGKFSSTFHLKSKLDEKQKMLLPSITANGYFSTNNVKLVDSEPLNSLKSVVKSSKLKNLELDNFTVEFEIREGNLYMKPFKTALGDQAIYLSGVYNLAGTLDYRIDATLDRDILSDNIQSIISYMPGHESITKVDVGIDLTGDIKKPDVKIDTDKIKKQVVDQVKKSSPKEIKDAVKKLLNKYFN